MTNSYRIRSIRQCKIQCAYFNCPNKTPRTNSCLEKSGRMISKQLSGNVICKVYTSKETNMCFGTLRLHQYARSKITTTLKGCPVGLSVHKNYTNISLTLSIHREKNTSLRVRTNGGL